MKENTQYTLTHKQYIEEHMKQNTQYTFTKKQYAEQHNETEYTVHTHKQYI
jgi:hypothetical protein